MRACVFALAVTAIAQPAFAHGHSHRLSRHIAYAHDHHYSHHRVAHVRREAPIESGYAMPQSFARTDAIDSPFRPQVSRAQVSPSANTSSIAGTFAERAPMRPARTPVVRDTALDAMIARHAAANGLPAELVHRVVIRESRYNPRARNGGALGLMQIKYATARGMGYTGPASGLFDAETNLTYAVRYLAGAYRAAGGNANRAVAYYASGYRGRGPVVARAPRIVVAETETAWGAQSEPVALRHVHRFRHRR